MHEGKQRRALYSARLHCPCAVKLLIIRMWCNMQRCLNAAKPFVERDGKLWFCVEPIRLAAELELTPPADFIPSHRPG
jgi:hypothetical protein